MLHQALHHLLPGRCCFARTSGHGRGTTRSPSCVRNVLIGYQDVLVRRNLGLGVRQVLLRLCMDLVRSSLLDQLRVQRLFTGFPALTQLRVNGRISCSTPSRAMAAIFWFPINSSKSSFCMERLEHLFENAEHLAGLWICRPGEILSASTTTQPASERPCARLRARDHALA